jgi:hypothetical protein
MRGLTRTLVAAYCLMTAVYAFLASSTFTYQQFLRPRVSDLVARFGDWHAVLYWVWLFFAVVSLTPELTKAGRARTRAIGFALFWTAVGVALTIHPILPTLVDDHRSVLVGLVALAPLIWLSMLDHAAAASFLRQQPATSAADADSTERRLLLASVGTAVFVAIAYGLLTPLAIGSAFEPDLLTLGLSLGMGWSLFEHLVIFCGVFLLMALGERAASRVRLFRIRYAAAFVVLSGVFWVALQKLVGNAIGLDTAWGRVAMLGLSVSAVSTWAAVRCRQWADESAALVSGYDVFLGPAQHGDVRTSTVLSLAGILILAFTLAAVAGRVDWDFLLLKLGVLAVWIVTFTQLFGATAGKFRLSGGTALTLCAIPLVGYYLDPSLQSRLPTWLGSPGLSIRHTLDRYLVYNPTFRLADDALHRGTGAETPGFDRFVRANTGLSRDVTPIEIDFVPHLRPFTLTPKPNIFLFVIDSLRPDYLGPYNQHVHFTPHIAEFSAESMVFHNAFTRYGGTGLSMSAMWMGAAGPHRQYVQPFAPMNALEKLLVANDYRRYISMDHIMEQLLTVSPTLVPLDRGIPELEYDFCRTLDELEHRLQSNDDPSPVFAHTRSLNLHVAALLKEPEAPADAFPGFEARYAARVQRMDGCFGRFIDFLKRSGLYDRSLVILTSDHGEMLGEDRQWGHAYYLFPQVLQVPLIIHVPSSLKSAAKVDVDSIGFSTDITPTLYALFGYEPQEGTALMGKPLMGAPELERSRRRRATEVVAASYGAVWGVLHDNGRRLYIIDANHGREYAFSRAPRGPWHRVELNAGLRMFSQQKIREYIDEINREYGMTSHD